MSKKNKSKRRAAPAGRGRVVFGGEPKMSEVILDLADPLLDGDVSNPKEVDFIVQLTIAAWNKSMFPVERQAAMEKAIIDTLVPPGGDAEQVGTILQALEIVDDRRKKLFPNLRRFVRDYDLRVSGGRVELNVVSQSMSEDR
jgi:hypothetical protein